MFIKILPDGKLTLVNAQTIEELRELFEKERQENIKELEQVKASNIELSEKIVLEGDNDTVINRKTKADYDFNAYKQQQMIDRLMTQTSIASEKIYEIELKEING